MEAIVLGKRLESATRGMVHASLAANNRAQRHPPLFTVATSVDTGVK